MRGSQTGGSQAILIPRCILFDPYNCIFLILIDLNLLSTFLKIRTLKLKIRVSGLSWTRLEHWPHWALLLEEEPGESHYYENSTRIGVAALRWDSHIPIFPRCHSFLGHRSLLFITSLMLFSYPQPASAIEIFHYQQAFEWVTLRPWNLSGQSRFKEVTLWTYFRTTQTSPCLVSTSPLTYVTEPPLSVPHIPSHPTHSTGPSQSEG